MPERSWGLILAIGIVGYGVSIAAQCIGTALATADLGAIITSATPAFMIIFSVRLLHEHVTWLKSLAVLTATLGVFMVIPLGPLKGTALGSYLGSRGPNVGAHVGPRQAPTARSRQRHGDVVRHGDGIRDTHAMGRLGNRPGGGIHLGKSCRVVWPPLPRYSIYCGCFFTLELWLKTNGRRDR